MHALFTVAAVISTIVSIVVPITALGGLVFLAIQQVIPQGVLNTFQKASAWLFVLLALMGTVRAYDGAGSGWTVLAFMGALVCVAASIAALLRLWRDETEPEVEDDGDEDGELPTTAYLAGDDPGAAYAEGAVDNHQTPVIPAMVRNIRLGQ